MAAKTTALRRIRRKKAQSAEVESAPVSTHGTQPSLDISLGDPLLGYLESAGGPVDLESLELESPAVDELRAARVKVVVPLIAQGELIGLLNLGPRLSEQEYSADDRKLLDTLAGQAAPAVRVAQLVRQQEAEARERERVEQELKVAQLIQQQFLPHELPHLPAWHIAAFYRPAREVGGDFYDFIDLPEGKLGIVVGDVTDKGVPAALVMAMTQSLLSAEAPRLVSPSEVMERVNNLLVADMPPKMFVTCLYAVLEPSTGKMQYANAGHNVPYVATEHGVAEFRATGMPLGLLPDMKYEEKEGVLGPGDTILLHSDGLAEAHNAQREMFGFPRLVKKMENPGSGEALIDDLLKELDAFAGAEAEQEDDITLVTLKRSAHAEMGAAAQVESSTPTAISGNGTLPEEERTLVDFELPSEPGNERIAIDRVTQAVEELELPPARVERLKTAVAEATMNAIEHGNDNEPETPVRVWALLGGSDLIVRVTDQGGDKAIADIEQPDIEAKLAGEQKARGWGLFLIKNMVDEMNVDSDGTLHTIELKFHLKGESNGT
jgi:serine phosphatase RsbU (regulator of sigma subunit)/anti-sigma regulatory factor (Ser/Thr protein kinase)